MKGKRRELFGKCILFLKMVKKKSRPIGNQLMDFRKVESGKLEIEPTSKAWEAFILPMNYARITTLFYQRKRCL